MTGGRGRVHDLKCHPPWWEDINSGRKTVEIRFNDRDYWVGDILILREWVRPLHGVVLSGVTADGYTGRVCQRVVTHILEGSRDGMGLVSGYVALSLSGGPGTDRGLAMDAAVSRFNTDAHRVAEIQDDTVWAQGRAVSEQRYLDAIHEVLG